MFVRRLLAQEVARKYVHSSCPTKSQNKAMVAERVALVCPGALLSAAARTEKRQCECHRESYERHGSSKRASGTAQ